MNQNFKKLQKECDIFNNAYPVGTFVVLKKDFIDEPVKTEVISKSFVLSERSAVAFFKNISGCYLISCVKSLA